MIKDIIAHLERFCGDCNVKAPGFEAMQSKVMGILIGKGAWLESCESGEISCREAAHALVDILVPWLQEQSAGGRPLGPVEPLFRSVLQTLEAHLRSVQGREQ